MKPEVFRRRRNNILHSTKFFKETENVSKKSQSHLFVSN